MKPGHILGQFRPIAEGRVSDSNSIRKGEQYEKCSGYSDGKRLSVDYVQEQLWTSFRVMVKARKELLIPGSSFAYDLKNHGLDQYQVLISAVRGLTGAIDSAHEVQKCACAR